MQPSEKNHRELLAEIAYRAMLERGLLPEFSTKVISELSRIQEPAHQDGRQVKDLRGILWSSIDNDDSRDLDQLSTAEALPDGKVKILVAIADVDALVHIHSAIDGHARHNTTSVYTVAKTFPMLPEKLSTDLTSLNHNEDRMAIVIEMVIAQDGTLLDSDLYRGMVRNRAQLAYNSVSAWLEDDSQPPEAITSIAGLSENLRLQDRVAQQMRSLRHVRGALSLETIEAKPKFDGDRLQFLEVEQRNRAKDIIEDFMIAANGVAARFLAMKEYPSIRRVVRTPKRWERIVELASEHGYDLPVSPDPVELEKFLNRQKIADPLRFPDLSLAVVKLLGAGEYTVDVPNETPPGHFGLAVKDYTHSTAPNRRYTDLITHRLLKSALEDTPLPYSSGELETLAQHCTEEEDAVNKVERQVGKSAAALLLEPRIGERFDAIVTGAAAKGTWVRLLDLPVEGKLVEGFAGVDVGQRIRVQLVYVDVDRGYIDFKKVKQ